MLGFLRLFFWGWGVYLFYILSFPDWKGSSYHFVTLTLIFAGAAAFYLTIKTMKVTSTVAVFLFEFAFAAGVLLYIGYTMPSHSGKPPIQQWAEGHKPTQGHARDGLKRLGLDPDTGGAKLLIRLFPKS